MHFRIRECGHWHPTLLNSSKSSNLEVLNKYDKYDIIHINDMHSKKERSLAMSEELKSHVLHEIGRVYNERPGEQAAKPEVGRIYNERLGEVDVLPEVGRIHNERAGEVAAQAEIGLINNERK
jgi:hypothetical protein